MALKFEAKEGFVFTTAILLLTDLAILLNIPFLRQILGFLFLTSLPGLLILRILKLNKLDFLEKFILAWGLSISFLMLFGLLLNNLSLSLGYETPLSTIPLLISFNIVFIILGIIGYKVNKTSIFSIPNLNLSTSERAFLIVPLLFPALSIFGMHLMNATDNNIILMFLLFLIPIYVVFVCIFNQKFSNRLYPVVIFLISISLLLLMALRSNHILGSDTHSEYYLFQTTLNNLHWSVFGHSTLDACLSISLLPAVYQSFLNIPTEFLYKILYSLIYSVSPLAIYVISKKYIGESYGFLASFFFMSQRLFLKTTGNSRTNTAILFFALAMMTLFSDKIDPLKKRILFVVFMVSCMVSHYATTYIFFFILFGSFLAMEVLSKKYSFKKVISLTIVILFFAFIFFWYSQVTETAFSSGVDFVEGTLSNLNRLFVEEVRGEEIPKLFGQTLRQEEIPYKISFFALWMTFIFIGIGILSLVIRYKEMSFPELNFKKVDFLREKFEIEYFVMALACLGLLVGMIALPCISTGYEVTRLYGVTSVLLSAFFVIGGIILSKCFFFLKKKTKPLQGLRGRGAEFHSAKRKSIDQNASQAWIYIVILLVLVPYFLCTTGVVHQIFGSPCEITLNSEGRYYDVHYIHDQESYGANWLKLNSGKNSQICTTDGLGWHSLISQGKISQGRLDFSSFGRRHKIRGYLYLSYDNVINGKREIGRKACNMSEYSDTFVGMSKIYSNGGSETWK